MRLQIFKNLGLLALALVWMAARSDGTTIYTTPPGLNVGDTYRLVFVTSTTTVATSPDISYYNSFVTNVADAVPELLALNATWTVIGSTSAVSAATNIGATNSGIYRLDGLEVAAGTAALFATGAPTNVWLMNGISITQIGDLLDVVVWTGTNPDGTVGFYSLGDVSKLYGFAGRSTSTSTSWIVFGSAPPLLGDSLPLYAISSELTVGGAAPEPTTIGLTALGGAFLLLARRQKRNHILK